MYKIKILKSAQKSLQKIPEKFRGSIAKTIRDLSENPRPSGCKKLKSSSYYRIRVSNYRVIYTIEDDKLLILIIKIGHRKNIYN